MEDRNSRAHGRPVEGVAGLDVGAFYSENPARLWRRVLGPGMHYHFGLFSDLERPVTDAAMDAALDEAVRVLYPQLPSGARVLDVGCGWGGTMRMLAAERGCRVTGLTNSRAQHAWCSRAGLEVIRCDVRDPEAIPRERYDVAVLLESLSHVPDKGALLRRLLPVAGRLVVRANCNQGARPGRATFGGSMTLSSRDDLLALIERSGWRILAASDRRRASMPSFDGWAMRLDRLDPAEIRGQLAVLRGFCDHARRWGALWAASNPLLDVVAERPRP